MRRLIIPLLLTCAAVASPAWAENAPVSGSADRDARLSSAFSQPPIEDAALADMRGGFGLPGGLQVAVAVQSDTRVNGLLLLRSVFVVDEGPAQLSVYGRADGASTVSNIASNGSSTSFSVTNQAAPVSGAAEGLRQLALTPGGVALATTDGNVRVDKVGFGNQVTLSTPTLDVSHLAGEAYGSIIANRGSDVRIDTVTNINIDLKNTLPSNFGSAMFRAEALAIDAAARIGR